MATVWSGRPRFLRFVPRPANTADSELAKAQPVFIDGLPDVASQLPKNTTNADALLVSNAAGVLSWKAVAELTPAP